MHTMRMAMANAELTIFFENIFVFFRQRSEFHFEVEKFEFCAADKNNDSIDSNDKHKLMRRFCLNCVFAFSYKIPNVSRTNYTKLTHNFKFLDTECDWMLMSPTQ